MSKSYKPASSGCQCDDPDRIQKLAVPVPGSMPGTLFVSSKITNPDVSEQLYNEWYDKTHIPDMFKTNGFKEAHRWKAIGQAVERPFLNTYPLENITFLNSEEFKSIPIKDDRFPGSGHVFDSLGFDIRCYEVCQVLEREPSSPAQATFIFIMGITPHTTDDSDEWQADDNADDRCIKPGWFRTERYQLSIDAASTKDGKKMRNEADLLENRVSKFVTIRYYDSIECPEGAIARTGKCERIERALAMRPNCECCWYEKVGSFKK